jgi:hypothetical protein
MVWKRRWRKYCQVSMMKLVMEGWACGDGPVMALDEVDRRLREVER